MEHFLIVGWNALGDQLVRQLETSAASGSTAEVLYDPTLLDAEDIALPEVGGLQVTLTPNRSMTTKLGAREGITSIVLLAYRQVLPPGEADSRTLLNLMSLRRELTARDGPPPHLIVELLDSDNVDLARMSGADDYVLSDALTSRLIAQLAEQPQRRAVLLSIYAPEGPSIHLIKAADLVADGALAWEAIVSAAYSAGMLAIGWRDHAQSEVVLNPRISDIIELGAGDEIVVIA